MAVVRLKVPMVVAISHDDRCACEWSALGVQRDWKATHTVRIVKYHAAALKSDNANTGTILKGQKPNANVCVANARAKTRETRGIRRWRSFATSTWGRNCSVLVVPGKKDTYTTSNAIVGMTDGKAARRSQSANTQTAKNAAIQVPKMFLVRREKRREGVIGLVDSE
jgi:hypothetical protein